MLESIGLILYLMFVVHIGFAPIYLLIWAVHPTTAIIIISIVTVSLLVATGGILTEIKSKN